MFESLSHNLTQIFDRLRGRAVLTEDNINEAMREVRIALLEADVALSVAKEFIQRVKEKAIGSEVFKSISPSQMMVKIVHDELTHMLGEGTRELNLATTPPAIIMMVGLQGSGKTTTTGKLAHYLVKKQKKHVLMASLDTRRPAAQEQLEVLGKQVQIDTLPIVVGEDPLTIAKRAIHEAKIKQVDVLFLDTAGRLHIDDELMEECKHVKALAQPIETLLVVDSLTGQDAVHIAEAFKEKIGVTGVILTRVDGDGRGGAALSMRAITGCPITFMGVGEKISELEPFHPERVASRILDMGDVVSLVEKAAESIDQAQAEKLGKKMMKGKFDLNDLAKQLETMGNMGGISSMLSLIPGIGKLKQQLGELPNGEAMMKKQLAIIRSMTSKERAQPDTLNGSRKRRVAAGAGVGVPEVNQLLNRFRDMQTMMKKIGKMDKKSLMRSGLGGMLPKKHP